jgi:hypothetical protein
MSTSHSPNRRSWRQGPATAKQLETLRWLCESRGQSFARPGNAGEAGDQINRLIKARPSSRYERARERSIAKATPVNSALVNAASVRDDEVTGYGSNARWAASHGDHATADAVCAPWDMAARRRRAAAENAESNYRLRAE